MGGAAAPGPKAAGKNPATARVVYVGGDPADGNAKQFHDGADKVMSAAGIKPVFETPGTWAPETARTEFEQAYASTKGEIDAVWAANDFNAASVIAVLDKNGKKIPVSGQDASPPGLRNILLGKQTATVYKPFQLESKATVDLAMELLKGTKPNVTSKDPGGTPFVSETSDVVTARNMQKVFDDGNAEVTDVCTHDVKPACDEAGLH